MLANGDKRDCFVVVDQAGGHHALNKKLTGQTLAEMRDRLADLDRAQLPSVEQAQAMQRERHLEGERTPEPAAPTHQHRYDSLRETEREVQRDQFPGRYDELRAAEPPPEIVSRKPAQKKLKSGGLCLVYSGQMFLPQVLAAMGTHLDYSWIFAIKHTSVHLPVWNRKVWNEWKPVLVFAKRPLLTPRHDWVEDHLEGGGRDKQFHEWGQDAQEATYWIEKLTQSGALVVDPFVGGGAIPAACKATGRRWIGTEIDPGHAGIARERVK